MIPLYKSILALLWILYIHKHVQVNLDVLKCGVDKVKSINIKFFILFVYILYMLTNALIPSVIMNFFTKEFTNNLLILWFLTNILTFCSVTMIASWYDEAFLIQARYQISLKSGNLFKKFFKQIFKKKLRPTHSVKIFVSSKHYSKLVVEWDVHVSEIMTQLTVIDAFIKELNKNLDNEIEIKKIEAPSGISETAFEVKSIIISKEKWELLKKESLFSELIFNNDDLFNHPEKLD